MRLIDADALKRKLQKVATEAWKMKLNASIEKTFNQCMDYIDSAPTIKPKQGEWIPCSERLPSENGRAYLTYQCCEDTRRGWCQVLDYYDGWNCTKQDRESEIKGVVAWMPLPDPWKGADDD